MHTDTPTHACRDDYNSLTSDIFRLNVRPLIRYLSNAMYGCLIKLGANMAINGFCPIISKTYNHLWYAHRHSLQTHPEIDVCTY